MLNYFQHGNTEALDELITTIESKMQILEPNQAEYEKLLEHLGRLYGLRAIERPKKVSRDTWAIAGTNLIGIAAVLLFEPTRVITSKAFGMIMRPR